MRILAAASALAVVLAVRALAQSATTETTTNAPSGTITRSFDNERASGTTTVVRDREAGTFNRDTSVTRKSDGATMTGSLSRTKTDTGVSIEQSRTGFDGSTSSRSLRRRAIVARESVGRRRGQRRPRTMHVLCILRKRRSLLKNEGTIDPVHRRVPILAVSAKLPNQSKQR